MSENSDAEASNSVQIRKPKRVIHCSDGVYEEYSDEEEEVVEDLKNMSLIRKIGHSIIFGLDYLGEGLANILNITTPKYNYEIEQFKQMEEERKKEEQLEKDNSWELKSEDETAQIVVTEVPKRNDDPTKN